MQKDFKAIQTRHQFLTQEKDKLESTPVMHLTDADWDYYDELFLALEKLETDIIKHPDYIVGSIDFQTVE